jgi:hypothetical protein
MDSQGVARRVRQRHRLGLRNLCHPRPPRLRHSSGTKDGPGAGRRRRITLLRGIDGKDLPAIAGMSSKALLIGKSKRCPLGPGGEKSIPALAPGVPPDHETRFIPQMRDNFGPHPLNVGRRQEWPRPQCCGYARRRELCRPLVIQRGSVCRGRYVSAPGYRLGFPVATAPG